MGTLLFFEPAQRDSGVHAETNHTDSTNQFHVLKKSQTHQDPTLGRVSPAAGFTLPIRCDIPVSNCLVVHERTAQFFFSAANGTHELFPLAVLTGEIDRIL